MSGKISRICFSLGYNKHIIALICADYRLSSYIYKENLLYNFGLIKYSIL